MRRSNLIFTGLLLVMTGVSNASAKESKLMQAVENGQSELIAKMPASTNWNETNAAGETALIKAVGLAQPAVVKALLKKKVNIDHRDKEGNTALLYAVSNNDKESALPLIQAKASLTLLYGDKKENILFEVARLGAREIGDEIIKRNKSLLNQKNSEGQTPVFVAIESDQHELASHFLDKGADPKVTTKSGKTLLETAQASQVEESSSLYKKLFKSR